MIVRGIARRNFKTKYFINPSFDLLNTKASMRNGLLEILIPNKAEEAMKPIDIEER
jgi:HSP20 family molecular chaperone IbpA